MYSTSEMARLFGPEIDYANVDLDIPELNINTTHWVHITHIVDPDNFYVRRTEHFAIIQNIESKKPSSKPTSWNVDDIIIINMNPKFETLRYARGKILQANMKESNSTCDIFMLDYGNVKKGVPVEDIWNCNPEIAAMPPLAMSCKLRCAPFECTGFNDKSDDAFKCYVGDERAKMKIFAKTDNQLIVELD